jgi:hypothetical protein
LFYLACIGLLSAVPYSPKDIFIVIAVILFARIEIRRHRSLNQNEKIWADIGECTYLLDDTGILLTHAKGQRKYEWATISSFKEFSSHFVLCYFDLANIFIPKRCIQDNQLDVLRSYKWTETVHIAVAKF